MIAPKVSDQSEHHITRPEKLKKEMQFCKSILRFGVYLMARILNSRKMVKCYLICMYTHEREAELWF